MGSSASGARAVRGHRSASTELAIERRSEAMSEMVAIRRRAEAWATVSRSGDQARLRDSPRRPPRWRRPPSSRIPASLAEPRMRSLGHLSIGTCGGDSSGATAS